MLNLQDKRILVTGGHGFIGQWVIDNLIKTRGLKPKQIIVPNSKRDDLRDFDNCQRLIKKNKIDVIIHLAAIVGGVGFSQKFPATQYYNNILMDLQIIEAAKDCKVQKIISVSSSCAYPKDSVYPLVEANLWNGLPQETNLAYGIGKRILSVQADAYRQEYGTNIVVVIPNNAYGPGDNFDEEYSHVIPALIRKCLTNDNPLVVWGDGTPTRDFLYVKDFAEGVILAAEKLETSDPVNLGTGEETSIKNLVELVQKLTNHTGKVVYDTSQPNGQPRRSVSIAKAKTLLGFSPQYSLEDGLSETIAWYKTNQNKV
ncbi:MAG: GDP-L-fucose synthase [bacterium]|nr:GDP-L-fucose synthase [bacterium]